MSRRPDSIATEPPREPGAETPTPSSAAPAWLVAWLPVRLPPWLTQRRIAWGLVGLMALAFAIFVGYHALFRHLEFHTD
ncbi:MAG TPA: hypothetical protein VFX31_11520, partial [Ktedonobacterales bacterium]|nr:hypothetical protein [Ktedonobacterales bacterium]